MDYLKRLSDIRSRAKKLDFDDSSKLALFSDCHRGDGGRADTFFRNRNICQAALEHYYREGFTYIELGDGDELWENRCLAAIIDAHPEVFERLSCFMREGRFYALAGNHDMDRACGRHAAAPQRDTGRAQLISQFLKYKTYEAIRLVYRGTGHSILLVHGHQVDFFNSTCWRLARFLVRHLWRPLESFGVNDPTSAAKNYARRDRTERRLIRWVEENRCMMVSGHTHRPVYPDRGTPPYFNDGSCVHPGCVTAVEIEHGTIALVKWCVKVRADGVLYAGRDVMAGPEPLEDFFYSAP